MKRHKPFPFPVSVARRVENSLELGWHRVKFGDLVRLPKARCADPLTESYQPVQAGQVLFGERRA